MGGPRLVGVLHFNLLSPHLNDERLKGKVLEELLSDGVHREVLAVVEVWVGGVGDGGRLCVLVVEVETVLAVDSLCEREANGKRERERERNIVRCMAGPGLYLPW